MAVILPGLIHKCGASYHVVPVSDKSRHTCISHPISEEIEKPTHTPTLDRRRHERYELLSHSRGWPSGCFLCHVMRTKLPSGVESDLSEITSETRSTIWYYICEGVTGGMIGWGVSILGSVPKCVFEIVLLVSLESGL